MEKSLETIVRELKARQDIHDVLVRYCRSADLCDAATMKACYHDDATDDHGFYNGPADIFTDNAVRNLSSLFSSTRHVLANEYVELDGDVARVESYVLCLLRMDGGADGLKGEGEIDVTARCRYLDRFECRDGVWKIAHRQLVSDGTRIDRLEQDYPRLNSGAPGARGSEDPSVAFFSRSTESMTA